jgi:putative peptide zinc metalloprotease protein
MSTPLFSQSWHRVAQLRPRIRPHAQIHRHHYRGRRWYVLQDHATGAFHRFQPSAHFVIGLMNGERTVDEIWQASLDRLRDDAPTQDELVQLMAQLHAADILLCDVPPDAIELLERYHRKQSAKFTQRWSSPLALRFPLVDPDRFLDKLVPFVRPVFGWVGALVWAAVVATAAVLTVTHWPELTENVSDRVLTPGNLVLMALIYPLIKLLHELGHALSTKVWHGEVHEMGIMLLVLMPIPYVDASAASAFRRRRRRVIVGAAGIIVELFLAALALFAWLNVQPGLLRATAYNVMLIGGVSTLLINGNPLLRFDGYYILSDLLEIPNLAQRSQAQLRYLADRYLFGVTDADSPASARGESTWFLVYGVAGAVYRVFLFTVIILFIAGRFFFIGVLLALWASFGLLVRPIYKSVRYVLAAPNLARSRARAVLVSGGLLVGGLIFFFVVPVPSSTRAEGVIWIAEDSIVRAGANGFIEEVLVDTGERVSAGQPLITSTSPELRTRARVLELRVTELDAREQALRVSDQVAADIARQEKVAAEADLERARQELDALTMRAGRDGTLVLTRARDLPGHFARKGEVLGYVLDLSTVTARVVVTQADVDLVRRQTESVSARLVENRNETPARILREVPQASDHLPSNVLGTAGGGQIAIDPRFADGTAMQTLFQFDIALLPEERLTTVGGRVHVRFDHGNEPMARQVYRSVRQLLLRRFRV